MSKINDGLLFHLQLDVENKKAFNGCNPQINGTFKGGNDDTKVEYDAVMGKCLAFSYSADEEHYVEFPLENTLSDTVTISVWFYIFGSYGRRGSIVNIEDETASPWNCGLFYSIFDNLVGFIHSYHANGMKNFREITLSITELKQTELKQKQWYHLAAVAKKIEDGSSNNYEYAIYFNGEEYRQNELKIDNKIFQKISLQINQNNYYNSKRKLIAGGNTENRKSIYHKIKDEHYVGNIEGEISNVRVYKRALSGQEIKELIEADKKPPVIASTPTYPMDKLPPQTGNNPMYSTNDEQNIKQVIEPDMKIPTYRKGHPIDFNLFDENDDYVLYISDDPTEKHLLKLELKNSSTQAIKFLDKGQQASKDNCHFELVFRLDTLSKQTLDLLRDEKKKIETLNNPEQWDVAISPENSQKQTVSLYLLYKNTNDAFEPEETLLVALKNISSSSGSGSRGTQVELKLRELAYLDDYNSTQNPKRISGTQLQKLQIINHLGRKNIPLHVGFVESNRILNDGQSPSTLTLRITNISNEPISLKGASFIFSFDVGNEAWAIATNAQFKPTIKAQADKPIEIKNPASEQGVSPEWIIEKQITNLEPNKAIEITISNIVTSSPSGYTNLYIGYDNIPGYWDGQFVCVIEKSPLLFFGNNVCIGTTNPSAKLEIQAEKDQFGLRVNGSISTQKLFANGNVGIGTTNPISQLSISNNLTGRDNKPDQILGEITFVGFNRAKASASIKAQSPGWDDASHLIFMTSAGASGAEERMRIQSDGNIGIGTTSPSAKLEIEGGDIKIATNNQGILFAEGAKIYQKSGSGLTIQSPQDSNIIEFTKSDNTTVMSLKQVDVGTTKPSYQLNINGDIIFNYGRSIQVNPNQGDNWTNTKILETSWDENNKYDYVKLYTAGNGNAYDAYPKITLKSSNIVDIGTEDKEGQRVTLNVYGDFHIKGSKPIVYQKYTFRNSDNITITTDYLVSDWVGIIGGISTADYFGSPGGIKCLLQEELDKKVEERKWQIVADLLSVADKYWEIVVLFIKKELVEVKQPIVK